MFRIDHPKLKSLAAFEGYDDPMDMLKAVAMDSVVPAICTHVECNAASDLEPDQHAGYCECCGRQTMQSCLVIAGII